MTKTYQKIHKQCDLLRYFLSYDFTFDTTNTKHLLQSMTPIDRKVYNFDMAALNWDKYFHYNMKGIRKFIAKDDDSTIPRAKKLYVM